MTASDGDGGTTDQTITVTVNNLNDNDPVFTNNGPFNIDEGGTALGTLAASDADGGTVSFSLSGTDAVTLILMLFWCSTLALLLITKLRQVTA